MTREALPRSSEFLNDIWILPTGWVGVSTMRPAETEVMVSPLCLVSGITLNCQTLCLGTRSRHSFVVDEDVKKPTNLDSIIWPISLSSQCQEKDTLWIHTVEDNDENLITGTKLFIKTCLKLSQKLNSGQNSERKTLSKNIPDGFQAGKLSLKRHKGPGIPLSAFKNKYPVQRCSGLGLSN